MTWLRIVCLFLAAAGIGHAGVTAAWKVPVAGIAPLWEAGNPPALEKPPGESAFFQPGDGLFDLTGVVKSRARERNAGGSPDDPFAEAGAKPPEDGWHGDWVVWNARSERIVARGSWNDIAIAKLALGGADLIPKILRTTLELSDHKGKRTFSLVSRSGELSGIELHGFKASVEAAIGEGECIETRLKISWDTRVDKESWEIETAVSARDGQRLRVARQGHGDDAWELAILSVCETPDGTPWKEANLLESKDGPIPMREEPRGGVPIRAKLDARQWIGVFQVPPGPLAKLFPADMESPSTVAAPSNASEWVRGPLLSVRRGLKSIGLDLAADGSFAGVDTATHRLFVVGAESTIELVDQIFATFGPDGPEPPVWIETNPESGGWGLACRSGDRGSIKRSSEGKGDVPLFEIEATRGATGVVFDLRYALDVVTAEDGKAGELMSFTTLIKDRPQVVASVSGPDGKDVKVIVTGSDAIE